jgi:hypothetical protein
MQRKLRRIADKYPDAIRGALHFRAELIMTDAKEHYVPVDLSGLKNSGHVEPPERGKGREIRVALVFGETSIDYAISVHEHPSAHDPPSWRGAGFGKGEAVDPVGRGGAFSGSVRFKVGGPKYLELPLMKAVPHLARDLAKDLHVDKVTRGIV